MKTLLYSSFFFFFTFLPALAQDAVSTTSGASEPTSSWFSQVFGVSMWPIWLLSIVLVTLIFERSKAMRRDAIIDDETLDQAIDVIAEGRTPDAISILETSPTRICQAWAQGLRVFLKGREPLAGALTTTSTLALKPLKKNISAIATIGVIAPLFGLLGTVGGMIMTFSQLALTGGGDKAALAGGIGLALFTTVGGLIIAIPAIVSGRYFGNKLTSYAEEVELAINRADYCYPHESEGKTPEKPEKILEENPS